MPKAEVGSVKHLNNQMKARGLTRLRWYCQECQRGMRDENAFKQHTMSEGHVRNILLMGSDPRKAIQKYSDQFLKDFLQLLRTGHGEKQVQINHFYQEYIANRDHTHMNATQWSSLTDLAKYLGKEGICRVEENEKGIFISWIDNSPEALRRQEALRRKEAQDRGDEEMERRMLKAQIERAERAAQDRKNRTGDDNEDEAEAEDETKHSLQRQDGEKVKLSFGGISKKPVAESSATPASTTKAEPSVNLNKPADAAPHSDRKATQEAVAPTASKPVSLKFGAPSKPQAKNVFAAAKKNALGGGKTAKKIEVPKKMSEAERIMKEEMERKRGRDSQGGGGRFGGPNKKIRF